MHTERSDTRRRAETQDDRSWRAAPEREDDEATPLVVRERAICDLGRVEPEGARRPHEGDPRGQR